MELNQLDMRWTFGAHEPFAMYRRVGNRCTGGIDGNARWLKEWMDWFDAEAPAFMESLGFNWLHCRFYKGMGWETEKKDFPNVKRLVENCHRHGIRALAYVQFSTLYPETMGREIANLGDWAQIDENGRRRTYFASYFRWLPCITCDEWVEYLERVCTVALAEGGFDGILFDNAFARPCWCGRCERRFREHLAGVADPKGRFGLEDLSSLALPRPGPEGMSGEIRDPVVQEWIRWRQGTLEGVFARLRAHAKSVNPDAVVCANAQPFRREDAQAAWSVDMERLSRSLDLLMLQSDNFPEVLPDGGIVNRVRDLKICRELGKPAVALCDSDAKLTEARERHYLLPLFEDLIWGGVPTDRTILSPKPVPGFIDAGMVGRRRPRLAAFEAFARERRTALAATPWQPVRLLWTPGATGFSREAHLGLAAAEEICLRNQIPFGYAIASGDGAFAIPCDCEVLVVANQVCLSDAQIAAISAYARRGGRLVVTGDSGRYDEWNAQRLLNPLPPRLAGLPNVVLRAEPDRLPSASFGWGYRAAPPADGGAALVADIAGTGWNPPVRVIGAPLCVFADFRRVGDGFALFLLNYDPDAEVAGVSVVGPSGRKVRYGTIAEDGSVAAGTSPAPDGSICLPTFRLGAFVEWGQIR